MFASKFCPDCGEKGTIAAQNGSAKVNQDKENAQPSNVGTATNNEQSKSQKRADEWTASVWVPKPTAWAVPIKKVSQAVQELEKGTFTTLNPYKVAVVIDTQEDQEIVSQAGKAGDHVLITTIRTVDKIDQPLEGESIRFVPGRIGDRGATRRCAICIPTGGAGMKSDVVKISRKQPELETIVVRIALLGATAEAAWTRVRKKPAAAFRRWFEVQGKDVVASGVAMLKGLIDSWGFSVTPGLGGKEMITGLIRCTEGVAVKALADTGKMVTYPGDDHEFTWFMTPLRWQGALGDPPGVRWHEKTDGQSWVEHLEIRSLGNCFERFRPRTQMC